MAGLIGAMEVLIAKKRAIKQAAMQQLLTCKTRLSGFSGKWRTKRLGEVASIRNQKVLPSNVDLDTPCVELDHIEPGDGRLLECSMAQNSTSPKYRFFVGDVLFGRLRPYLRKFWHAAWDGICTTEIWPLMVNTEQADSGFLHAIVQSNRFIATASISLWNAHAARGLGRNVQLCGQPSRKSRSNAPSPPSSPTWTPRAPLLSDAGTRPEPSSRA